MKIIRACFLLTAGVAILSSTGSGQSAAAAEDFRSAPVTAASAPFPGATGGEDGDDTGWG